MGEMYYYLCVVVSFERLMLMWVVFVLIGRMCGVGFRMMIVFFG